MTTTTAPLPLTRQLLDAHYLPPQPDSTVTAAHRALRRLGELHAAVRGELAELTSARSGRIAALVDTAGQHDTALDEAIAAVDVDAGRVGGLEQRLAVVDAATRLAADRHLRGQQTDPIHLAWLRRCNEIVADWRRVSTAGYDDDTGRRRALEGFAYTHRTDSEVTP